MRGRGPGVEALGTLVAVDATVLAEIARRLELPVGSIGPMRGRGLEMLRRSFDAADAA
jgi:hypothetical protein